MILTYALELDDHLAWFDLHDQLFPQGGVASWPIIGSSIKRRRRERYRLGLIAPENYLALGERSIEISARGVREFNEIFDHFVRWSEYTLNVASDEYIFLAQPSMNARVVPLRACKTAEEREALISAVQEYSTSTPPLLRPR
jgi:hypothetical protein